MVNNLTIENVTFSEEIKFKQSICYSKTIKYYKPVHLPTKPINYIPIKYLNTRIILYYLQF